MHPQGVSVSYANLDSAMKVSCNRNAVLQIFTDS